MRRALPLLFCGLCAAAPASFSFGGFSTDGKQFLKRGSDDRACTVALPPLCEPVDRRSAKDFVKPPRSRKLGGITVEVVVEDGAVVLRAGETLLGRFHPIGAAAVTANTNVFVSPDELAVAVEYEAAGKAADVVVFPILKETAPVVRSTGAAPTGSSGNAFDRVLARGGVWEQRMVACDQAGVRLTLKKTKTFDLRVDTKCQADKDTTQLSGKWTTEGADRLELTFENQNGPSEALPCRLAKCSDEDDDCLSCADAEVSFVLRVVRR